MEGAGGAQPRTDPVPEEVLDALSRAVATTFAAILGEEPTRRDPAPPASFTGLIGSIAFEGERSFGVDLVLPDVTIENMAKKFTGVRIGFECEQMEDVAGELANVLAGDIAAQLEHLNLPVALGLPDVERREDAADEVEVGAARLAFSSADGDFRLTVRQL